jgi:oligopeptide transport system substrate-binding protein
MVRTVRHPIYLLILALILSACMPPGTVPSAINSEIATPLATSSLDILTPATEPPAAETSILRINMGTFPDIIDPQKSSSVNDIAVLKMVYEGLTRLDGDLNTVPAAAEAWEYNEDATQLTFTLRDGLTYSDGSPLNAARFEYSFHRNNDPTIAGLHTFSMDEIIGAAEWRSCLEDCDFVRDTFFENSRASHADGSDCTGYDDAACNTFTLKFQQPAPYFHTVASLWVVYPAKQELIESGGEEWWLDVNNHIGNGPFVMTNLEQNVNVHMIPNEEYWADGPSYELDYSYITDPAVAFEDYKNGELDIIVTPANDLATIRADTTLSGQVMIYPSSCTFAVMFHQLKEPFSDPAVRQAFAYALDREGWVNDVLQGLGAPTLTWIPPGFPGYKKGEARFGYDPEKAKQTLANAGYIVENGQLMKEGQAIEITNTFSDTPRNRARNEWLVAKWKEVLGIDIPLNPVDATTYTNLIKDIVTSPQVFIFGWCAEYPDPQNWFSVWKSNGKISAFGERIGFSNPEMDDIMAQADVELDPDKRADLYQQAQDMLVEKGYVAFMWNTVNSYLVQPWVQGISQTPMDTDWPGAMVPTSITIEAHQTPQ